MHAPAPASVATSAHAHSEAPVRGAAPAAAYSIQTPGIHTSAIDFESFWLHGVANAADIALSTAAGKAKQAHILVVDDSRMMRAALVRELNTLGYTRISQAQDGHNALQQLEGGDIDLVLLDMEMPGLSGMDVLKALKTNDTPNEVPVIVISGAQDQDRMVQCIELGAEDFLPKPFNQTLLKARVLSGIEKKLLRDLELARLDDLRKEKEHIALEKDRSDHLLLNILPQSIAHELKNRTGEIAQAHPEVTVLFSDLVGFTSFSRTVSAKELVHMLNKVFSAFDDLAHDLKLEKIKTIGDAYMLVGGLTDSGDAHAQSCIRMGQGMVQALDQINREIGSNLQMRIGMHTGAVVAGVIGKRKFAYDIWGDTVNTASRMESTGKAGRIHVSHSTYSLAQDAFTFEPTGGVECKGIGLVPSYLVV
jgi:adenylate cyclase